MSYNVYWLKLPEHTDMFSQGYVGITNSTKDRFESHKNRTQNKHLKNAIDKYGWDNLIKEVVLVSDKSYCLMIEKILRPLKNIGWNIIEGGGMPPKTLKGCNKGKPSWNKGKPHSEETRKKLSNALKGRKTWNKGVSPSEETRLKYRIAKLGRKLPMETRIKMSQAHQKRKELGEQHGE